MVEVNVRSDVAAANRKEAVGELEAETLEEAQCMYSGEAKQWTWVVGSW